MRFFDIKINSAHPAHCIMPTPSPITAESHRALHARAMSAVGRLQESQAVDFKESQPWETLQDQLVKTIMAMANLRDGGLLIIGVSEREGAFEVAGVSDSDFETYDADIIHAQIGKYADPHPSVELGHIGHEDKRLIVIGIAEFTDLPIICRRGKDGVFRHGAVYVRPTGTPRTEEIRSADAMRDLLEVATDKRTVSFLQTAQKRGLPLNAPNAASAEESYDAEVKDFD